MLKQRILTAIAMLLVLLPALFHSDIRLLALLSLILIGAASWEWARLNGSDPQISFLFGGGVALFCLLFLLFKLEVFLNTYFWLLVSGAWVLLSGYLLQGGQSKWLRANQYLRMVIGPVMLISAWLALYESKLMGTAYLLSILLLVWVADVAAYFAGRQWGRHKLAPNISPGKSWEGLVGGILGVFILSLTWLGLDDVFPILQGGIFQRLRLHGWLLFFFSILFLTLMSVVGDLIESLIKRAAGAKDSSQLLPGHGGVLDRLDALLPVLPLAIMLTQYQ
jgi:phosphatidate cytidylyltransferase